MSGEERVRSVRQGRGGVLTECCWLMVWVSMVAIVYYHLKWEARLVTAVGR